LFSYFELCTTVRELESPEHMIFCWRAWIKERRTSNYVW
jgi:hypothetical protein